MNKKDYGKITIIFLMSRIVFLFFLLYYRNISAFTLYDVENYLKIARYGYNSEMLYAFFPLYSILIRLFHIIIPSYEITAIILSNIFSYLSTILVYKIVDNKKYNTIAIILFLFSPILVYNTIGYTESLFLLLTLTAFYLYKKEKYFLCGIAVAFSMLTRNSGIVLLGAIGLGMLIDIYKKKKTIKDLIIFVVPPLLIGFSYNIYLYFKTGDPFKYVAVQFTVWHRSKCNPITLFIKEIQYMSNSKYFPFINLQNLVFYCIGLLYGFKNIKKEKEQSIFLLVSLFLFTTTYRNSTWIDIPSSGLFRYVFGTFPMYLLPFSQDKEKVSLTKFIPYLSISIINEIMVLLGLFIS